MTAQPYPTPEQLREQVAAAASAAAAYYDSADLEMTDADYDLVLDRIAATVAAHPDWDTDGVAAGLLECVAGGMSAGGSVTHPTPMLSMAKATEAPELDRFVAALGSAALVVEPKIDGMAVRAVYRGGQLTLVVTRGDGTSGEDVTAQAQAIAGLPVRLREGVDAEIRGEVYMSDADFAAACANRVGAGKAAFANPRNATAGTLRAANRDYDAPLSFACYDASGDALDALDLYSDRMVAVAELGVATALEIMAAHAIPTGSPAETVAALESARPTLGLAIDGAVVKADSYTVRERLGAVSRSPRWALAWKYPAEQVSSVLRGIEVTVGRTGRMALTGIIDPVPVAGAVVARATLHNPAWLAETGLGIGSPVAVSRANDVIPRIVPLAGADAAGVSAWVAPSTCPQCDQPWDTSSLLWRCHSPECSIVGKLVYASSRAALDIERLGEAVCEALVETGLAADIADLYDLTREQWAALPVGDTAGGAPRLLGETTADFILAELAASKNQPFHRVLTALGLRGTGRSLSRSLAAAFPSMAALRSAGVEQLAGVDKIGPVKAGLIASGLASMGPVIDRLAAAGLSMEALAPVGEQPLAGKTYVISGTIPGWSRTDAQERVVELGGVASSSVSKATTALVTSETATSKAVKAAALGIPVIDPAEFAALLAR